MNESMLPSLEESNWVGGGMHPARVQGAVWVKGDNFLNSRRDSRHYGLLPLGKYCV